MGPTGDRHGLGSMGRVDLGEDGRQLPADDRGRVRLDGERHEGRRKTGRAPD